MPRTTKGGDDPNHELPNAEKDRIEADLREQARKLLRENKAKDSKRLTNRARNISRRESKKQEHH